MNYHGDEEKDGAYAGGTASLLASTRGKSGGAVFNQAANFNITALDGQSVSEALKRQEGTIASIVAEARPIRARRSSGRCVRWPA